MIAETGKSSVMPVKLVPPGIVWHYTTIPVLEYFVLGKIALSHYKFMNDDSELLHGRQLLKSVADGINDEVLKSILNKDFFDKVFSDTYLFCLSRDGDNLYQWRSYTPQGGIAVGFNRQELVRAIYKCFSKEEYSSHGNQFNALWLSCRYRDDFVERIISRLNHRLYLNKKSLCYNGCKELDRYLGQIIRVVLSQKNPSFKEEGEERLLATGILREKVVIIKGKPRIILECPDIAKSIVSVRLSPHGDVKRNKLLVEIIRDKYGLSFSIEQSQSSYNGR